MKTLPHDPSCDCFDQHTDQEWLELTLHAEKQNTGCSGWKRLLALIDEAAEDEREEFAPLQEMAWEERMEIVTLPPTISKLKSVKHLLLYRSWLVRIPPEIGAMTNLEKFTPYTSYKLHWYPFEITRCKKLMDSTVSTRSLYGNFKFRPPFPKLQVGRETTRGLELNNLLPEVWGTDSIKTCSVCNRPLEHTGLHQVWISVLVATDVLPLLVNACSEECIQALPKPADDYIHEPHMGGLNVKQPPPRF